MYRQRLALRAKLLDFPAKGDFHSVIESEVCLNNARWHPLSIGAKGSINEYLNYKARGGGNQADLMAEKQAEGRALRAINQR